VSTPVNDSLGGEAAAEREPKMLDRSALAASPAHFIRQLIEKGIQSACCVPFVTPKGVVGSFNLASTKENAFSSEDLDLLKQIALQLANALDNARARHDLGEAADGVGNQSLQMKPEANAELDFEEIVGESKTLRRVLDQAKTVAGSDATVLVLGNSGTGKDLIARAKERSLHQGELCCDSRRSSGERTLRT
jgi:formate hydrogenlyase transcriptional activator